MEPGIVLSVSWGDADVTEVTVSASNRIFSAKAGVYCKPSVFTDVASALRGFPERHDDVRHIELGTHDHVALQFSCIDRTGHCEVQVALISYALGSRSGPNRATIIIPTLAAEVDAFIGQLNDLAAGKRTAAILDGRA